MTHPTGPQQDAQPVPGAEPRPRAWFKKKRFIIPGAIVLLFVIIGFTGGNDDDAPEPPAAAEATPAAQEPEQTPEEIAAEEEAEAERQAEKAEKERLAEEAAAAEEAEAAAAEAEAATAAAAEEAAAGTLSQQNAYSKAESYLDYSAFSRSGLIGQLEYEGYPAEDAEFAVARMETNGGVDWNEQAAAKAASHLEYSSFSRSGLVGQLKYEGFTPEQAEHGASSTGL